MQARLPNGRSVPAAFALLPDKTADVYSLFWNAIKEKLGDGIKAKQMLLDFEVANITTFQEMFPEIEVSGCEFHFRKAIFSHIQKKKIVDLFNQSQEFQLFLNMVYSLAYVKPDDIVEVYDTVILEYLEENADLWPDWSDEIQQFVAYMDRTWIGNPPLTRNGRRRNPLFSFDLWNKWSEVQGNLPITNNSNEAYNNQWNRTTEANATMWTIIYNFQREDALSRKTVLDSMTDANSENYAVKERQKDRRFRIKNMASMYNEYPIKSYIKDMATILLNK